MNKLKSTVRSLLKLLSQLLLFRNKFIQKSALYGPIFFIFFVTIAHSEINIAIIDTGFCPSKIELTNASVKIENAIDLTNSVKLDCQNSKFNKFLPRFHGQLVIEEFLKIYNNKRQSIRLYPLIVFNSRGDQKSDYWIKTLDWINKNKIDMVISASGLITQKRLILELPGVWFVASGRITPQIKKGSSLFPQNLAPKNNLFLIGDFYDGSSVVYDQELLYQDYIDYYFPSGSYEFKGASRAVAEASARALNLCQLSNIRECLLKNRKNHIDQIGHKLIQTF